jgi:hypothetical protein
MPSDRAQERLKNAREYNIQKSNFQRAKDLKMELDSPFPGALISDIYAKQLEMVNLLAEVMIFLLDKNGF